MSMTILYPLGDSLYVNMTNRCTCRCTFCIRSVKDHVRESNNLWLDHEPTVEAVLEESRKFDLASYREIVFCGFGEPTERLSDLLEVAARWKEQYPSLVVRINTNGLADLRYGENTAERMAGVIDKVSVSMNASTKENYLELTRSRFGIGSYEAMLRFAVNCRDCGIDVQYSIVDVLPPEEIEECRRISEKMGVPLKVRKYVAE